MVDHIKEMSRNIEIHGDENYQPLHLPRPSRIYFVIMFHAIISFRGNREKYKEIRGEKESREREKVGRNTKKCWEREKSREKYKEIQENREK